MKTSRHKIPMISCLSIGKLHYFVKVQTFFNLTAFQHYLCMSFTPVGHTVFLFVLFVYRLGTLMDY